MRFSSYVEKRFRISYSALMKRNPKLLKSGLLQFLAWATSKGPSIFLAHNGVGSDFNVLINDILC